MSIALDLFMNAMAEGHVPDSIRRLFGDHAKSIPVTQVLPLLLQAFKDDMLQVSADELAEDTIEQVEQKIIKDKLGIQMSVKPDANMPFSTRFDFIGATFDTSDPANIFSSPTSHILTALSANMVWLATRKGKLALRKQALQFVGRLAFCARFVRLGRVLLNSSYAAVASAHLLHCLQDLIMVTHEMFADIMTFYEKLRAVHWTPVVVYPWFYFPGLEGFSSDAASRLLPATTATTPLSADGGWGVHVFGSVGRGR